MESNEICEFFAMNRGIAETQKRLVIGIYWNGISNYWLNLHVSWHKATMFLWCLHATHHIFRDKQVTAWYTTLKKGNPVK